MRSRRLIGLLLAVVAGVVGYMIADALNLFGL